MMRKLLLMVTPLLMTQAVSAAQVSNLSASIPSKTAPIFKKKHPLIYKAGLPVREVWKGVKVGAHKTSDFIIWFGKKTEPYQPAMNFLGAAGGMATPMVLPALHLK